MDKFFMDKDGHLTRNPDYGKGIKNFEDDESYYRFYLKECESENIKLIKKVEQLNKKVETINAIIRECEVKNIQTVTLYWLKQAMKD